MIIKFNFVPKKKKKPLLTFDWQKAYIVFIFIVVSGIIFSFLSLNRQLEQLENQKKYLEREKQKYMAIIKQIKQLEKKDEQLSHIIKAIVDLQGRRGTNLKIFDEVMLSVPLGKVYLSQFSLKNGRVLVNGFAMDYDNVAHFLSNLKKKGTFTDVGLQYAKKRKLGHYELIEFKITLH
ncbi:MAG: hypothetical protein DSZ24_00185 [Thermodesulfatator sp.]|nr:MAG: hypothetical protein DSZ24_00185 [Thermodesulfatator sp.]